jgi:hypothetical protein
MLQSMVVSQKVGDAARSTAQFVLQDLPGVDRNINNAGPAIPDTIRPQAENDPAAARDSLPVLKRLGPSTQK